MSILRVKCKFTLQDDMGKPVEKEEVNLQFAPVVCRNERRANEMIFKFVVSVNKNFAKYTEQLKAEGDKAAEEPEEEKK